MKFLICTAIFAAFLFSADALAQSPTVFQIVAGHWEGTLEYQDYSANKRVKLKTYLTVMPAADGNSAEFFTVYDDVSRIVKNSETEKIDWQAEKYFVGSSEYKIEMEENGKIILRGSGQDGKQIEPIRKTITFDENSFSVLKETRAPWQFRSRLTLKRAAESVLAKRTLSETQMKDDLKILEETLIKIHPGIYRYQTSESLKRTFAEAHAKISGSLPESEFFKITAQIISKIGCGHTFINPYNLNAVTRERVFGGNSLLPFYFQIVGGRMIVTENASPQNLSRGSEITHINGVAVKKILAALLTATKADGTGTLAHRLQSLELSRFEAERYAAFDMYLPLFFPPKNDSFNVRAVDFLSKKSLNFQTPAMTKEARTAEMAKRYGAPPTYDDGWRFHIRPDSVGYLKINNSITWRLKKVKFKEFLADAFAQMRLQNVANLVIDLRGNSGGDMNIGYELAKYLTRKNLLVYAESRRLVRNVAPQSDLLKYLDTYSDKLKSNLKDGTTPGIYRKAENDFYQILPNINTENFPPVTPYENNFRGTAYIIADSSAASATFQFLNYVRENRLATIVGQESGGNLQGINGGDYFFLHLPNSQIEIDIPVYFQAPLGAQKDSGVAPNVYVKRKPENVGRNIDEEMMKIQELIERNHK